MAKNIYLRLIGISIRSQLQYRTTFILQSLGQFAVTAIEFATLALLFARFGSYAGWSLREVAFLYGFVDIIFAFSDAAAYGFDSLGILLKRGDFDRLLLRPYPPVFQLLGQDFTIRRVGRLIQGIIVLLWGLSGLPAGTIGLSDLALLVASFVSGVTVFVSIFIMQGALTFVTTEGLEIVNALTCGGVRVMQYPLSGYR